MPITTYMLPLRSGVAARVFGHPRRQPPFQISRTLISSNSNENNGVHSLATNGGTVEAVFVFHRHGDRAPNRHLGDPSYLRNEAEHWYGRIPHSYSRTGGNAHQNLSRYFPPDIHPSQNDGKYMDVSREPFGFLTYRGMDQMRVVGQRFRRRYERFGRRIDASASNLNGHHDENQYSCLHHWDVQAFSTNYLRTVMSVQCFLDGLIGSKSIYNTTAKPKQSQIYAGGGLNQYYKELSEHEQLSHLDLSTWTTDGDVNIADNNAVKVQVRAKDIDTLNAFDRWPQMMNDLVKEVIATEQFQRIDGNAKQLAETLCSMLPGLNGAPQAFGGTPSGINWVHANDHFVCRRAHSVPLLAFSEYEGLHDENEVKEAFASLATPVCSHLAWRFREWYRCPRLLSAVACPPFKEMIEIMKKQSTNRASNDTRSPFVLYSCHDVTLLALLYAIGADFLVSGEDCGGLDMPQEEGGMSNMKTGYVRNGTDQKSWRWWPAYSSTIAFELVRLDDGCDNRSDDQYVIRVILNGETVKLIPRMSVDDEGLLKEQPLSSRRVFGGLNSGTENHHGMMGLSDFQNVINVLEEAGKGFTLVEGDSLELKDADRIGVEGG